jgi:hypothetical protein
MLRPEKRPFPIKIYNMLATAVGMGERLDFEKIIKKARSNTKLQDLGADFNDTSLRKLIESTNSEAQLHPFGVLMLGEKLISQLENRLWAEYWFKKHPEILEQEVLPVVLITGLQRTGTTRMQRLFSAHPEARSLLSWEALYPAPIGTKSENKKRISRTRRNEKAVRWISPAFQSIHPIHADQPEEDVLLLDVHFMSSSAEAILNVPSYASWLTKQNHKEAYLYEIKLLKLLQWQKKGKFWVLKSPHHLEYLHLIREIFPYLKIIWMHRPIENCVPSFLSMLYYSRAMFSANVKKAVIVEHWLPKLSKMLESGLTFKKRYSGEIRDVFFDDFLKSEVDTVNEIISDISLISSQFPNDESIDDRYLSKHKYSLEDWHLNVNDLNDKFDFYHQAIFKQPKVKYRNG